MSIVDVEIPVQRKVRRDPDAPARKMATPRIPRISRLMALAIKFQDMADRGEIRDYADLARLGYVSRARVTQIMNLLLLAPDIQQEVLGLERHATDQLFRERNIRTVVAQVHWGAQRELWSKIVRIDVR
jgi:hypothetical protein